MFLCVVLLMFSVRRLFVVVFIVFVVMVSVCLCLSACFGFLFVCVLCSCYFVWRRSCRLLIVVIRVSARRVLRLSCSYVS